MTPLGITFAIITGTVILAARLAFPQIRRRSFYIELFVIAAGALWLAEVSAYRLSPAAWHDAALPALLLSAGITLVTYGIRLALGLDG